MLVDLVLCRNRNFCVQCLNFHSVLERENFLKFLHSTYMQIVLRCPNFSEFLELQKYVSKIRSLQTVLFLTDSVLFS